MVAEYLESVASCCANEKEGQYGSDHLGSVGVIATLREVSGELFVCFFQLVAENTCK